MILGMPEPDPILLSLDPDPNPTCNHGFINFFIYNLFFFELRSVQEPDQNFYFLQLNRIRGKIIQILTPG